MDKAWDVIGLAFRGVIQLFMRLFDAFNMQDIVYPILFMSAVFGLIITPIVLRQKLSGKGRKG